MSTVKVRALTEKERGPCWEDPDKAGDIEPQNIRVFSASRSRPRPEINPALLEETLMASPEAAALKDTADCLDHPSHSLILDLSPDSSHRRPLQVQSVTHEEMHYTAKQLLYFSNSHRQKSGNMGGMDTKHVG